MLSEGTLRAHAHPCHLAIACPLWLTPGLLLLPRHCHPAPSYTYRGVSPKEPTDVHCDERLAQPPGSQHEASSRRAGAVLEHPQRPTPPDCILSPFPIQAREHTAARPIPALTFVIGASLARPRCLRALSVHELRRSTPNRARARPSICAAR